MWFFPPRTDCSGCIGGGYRCSMECYQYDACVNDCYTADVDSFCDSFGGEGCAHDDGEEQ